MQLNICSTIQVVWFSYPKNGFSLSIIFKEQQSYSQFAAILHCHISKETGVDDPAPEISFCINCDFLKTQINQPFPNIANLIFKAIKPDNSGT